LVPDPEKTKARKRGDLAGFAAMAGQTRENHHRSVKQRGEVVKGSVDAFSGIRKGITFI
jgi:hypothetical protein